MLSLNSLIFGVGIASISTLLFMPNANAGAYQALCGGTKCIINISSKEITSPFGSIPLTRITNWSGGGDTSKMYGKSLATSVVFAPFDLLGLVPKRHDYNFIVNGYDATGLKTSIQIQFLNDAPAKQFVAEMASVTDLGMGQERSATEIKMIESRQKSLSRKFKYVNQKKALTLDEAAADEQTRRVQPSKQPVNTSSQICNPTELEMGGVANSKITTSQVAPMSSQDFTEEFNFSPSQRTW